jgi:hypothetical protein
MRARVLDREPGLLGNVLDRPLALRQQIQNLDPGRARDGLADLRELVVKPALDLSMVVHVGCSPPLLF